MIEGGFHPPLEASWNAKLVSELNAPYFKKLSFFLASEYQNKLIFPPLIRCFHALNLTPFDQVKVIILGQDPYHNAHQAHGLAFSVLQDQPIPPSLKNIFQEYHTDVGLPVPSSGDLTHWAQEGVLLLNTVLTVEAHRPHSHQNKGWERFTDAVITKLSIEKNYLVFVLWGKPASQKKRLIDISKHLILEAPHPSPLSAYRGFFGSKPFSKINAYLQTHAIAPIDWTL